MGSSDTAGGGRGNARLWDRPLSRRQLIGSTAGLAMGGALGLPGLAAATPRGTGEPRPIPGGLSADFTPVSHDPFIHVFGPAPGAELSTITDFNGVVGATEIRGAATGSDGSRFSFDADMRFMEGEYVGTDGRLRHGSFGFI